MTRPWQYLVEADARLRRLERNAYNKDPATSAVKAYINALAKQNQREALITLIRDYNVLPNIYVTYRFEPETEPVEGHFTFQRDIDWVHKELAKGNEYAWCTGRVIVEWDTTIVYRGDAVLGGISGRNEKEAEEVMNDLVPDAAADLVQKIPNGPSNHRMIPSDKRDRAIMLKDYLSGKQNKDWVKWGS